MNPQQSVGPSPHETLQDEGGSTTCWLSSAWSLEDIEREWDWLFEDKPAAETLGECWYVVRWSTEEERADPDQLYDLFGSGWDEIDTTVVYRSARSAAPGAHRYWTTER